MSGIHINPANKGKFTETKKRTGKSTEELTHSKNPLTRKRAIFAQNARKWNHSKAEGGYLFADGGQINPQFAYGGNWSDGITEFNSGGSHEQNPDGGIPQGTDSNGTPNKVEQGETKWNNYIFSNRLTVPDDVAPLLGLKGKNVSFSKASKILQKEASERPNDPISKAGLTNSMAKLKSLQDIMKEQLEQQRTAQNQSIQGKIPAVNYGAYGMNLYDGVTGPTSQMNVGYADTDWSKISPEEQTFIQNYMKGLYQKFPALKANNPSGKQNVLYNYGYYKNKGNDINSFKYYKNGDYTPDYNNLATNLPEWVAREFNNNSTGKVGNNKNISKALIAQLMSDKHLGYAHQFGQGILDAHNEYLKTKNEGNPPLNGTPQVSNGNQGGVSNITNGIPWNDRGPYDYLRYAPVVGGALGVIGDLTGATNKPDYSYGNYVANAATQVGRMGAPHIGNYLRNRLMDRQYYLNQINSQAAATNAALRNNSGGNRAALNASLIGSQNNYANATGDLGLKAQLYNNQLRQQTGEFNRGTDQYNADQDYRVNLANMDLGKQYAAYADRAAQLNMQQDLMAAQGRSANLTNFFNNLGELGRESQQRGWLKNLAMHDVFHTGNFMNPDGTYKKDMTVNSAKNGGLIKTKKQKHITY